VVGYGSGSGFFPLFGGRALLEKCLMEERWPMIMGSKVGFGKTGVGRRCTTFGVAPDMELDGDRGGIALRLAGNAPYTGPTAQQWR
jgi:hypothetical protein